MFLTRRQAATHFPSWNIEKGATQQKEASANLLNLRLSAFAVMFIFSVTAACVMHDYFRVHHISEPLFFPTIAVDSLSVLALYGMLRSVKTYCDSNLLIDYTQEEWLDSRITKTDALKAIQEEADEAAFARASFEELTIYAQLFSQASDAAKRGWCNRCIELLPNASIDEIMSIAPHLPNDIEVQKTWADRYCAVSANPKEEIKDLPDSLIAQVRCSMQRAYKGNKTINIDLCEIFISKTDKPLPTLVIFLAKNKRVLRKWKYEIYKEACITAKDWKAVLLAVGSPLFKEMVEDAHAPQELKNAFLEGEVIKRCCSEEVWATNWTEDEIWWYLFDYNNYPASVELWKKGLKAMAPTLVSKMAAHADSPPNFKLAVKDKEVIKKNIEQGVWVDEWQNEDVNDIFKSNPTLLDKVTAPESVINDVIAYCPGRPEFLDHADTLPKNAVIQKYQSASDAEKLTLLGKIKQRSDVNEIILECLKSEKGDASDEGSSEGAEKTNYNRERLNILAGFPQALAQYILLADSNDQLIGEILKEMTEEKQVRVLTDLITEEISGKKIEERPWMQEIQPGALALQNFEKSVFCCAIVAKMSKVNKDFFFAQAYKVPMIREQELRDALIYTNSKDARMIITYFKHNPTLFGEMLETAIRKVSLPAVQVKQSMIIKILSMLGDSQKIAIGSMKINEFKSLLSFFSHEKLGQERRNRLPKLFGFIKESYTKRSKHLENPDEIWKNFGKIS